MSCAVVAATALSNASFSRASSSAPRDLAARRADPHAPAAPVAQRRSQDLVEKARPDIGGLVDDEPVEIEAAQRVRVVGAVEAHLAAIRQVEAQLALMGGGIRYDEPIGLEVVPCDALRLLQLRRHVGEARSLALELDRGADEIVDAGDGLSARRCTTSTAQRWVRSWNGMNGGRSL
jgi:hypothetical protein